MARGLSLSAPEAFADHHDVSAFESGVAELDDWLRKRARGNQASGASRSFVVCDAHRVAGYYALASGAAALAEAPGPVRRNMPDPIPMIILGRLAVDRRLQGRGLGAALLRDAAQRVLLAADFIGVRGLVVHAISDEACAFYLARGFLASPLNPMTLMAPISLIRAFLA